MSEDSLGDDGLNEEAGEGYFASISDLMVGVLFVFLLMLTALAVNFKDDTQRLLAAQQATAHLRIQNDALRIKLQQAAEALSRELADREAARMTLLQRLAHGLQDRGIRFALDQRSGVLRLSDAVPFDTQSSDLTDTGRRTVDALADVLSDALPCFTKGGSGRDCVSGAPALLEAVLVEGHTDHQAYRGLTPLQSQQENDRLSTARALTVFAELRRAQPDLETLHNASDQALLGVSGYGERRPLPTALSFSDTDFAQNRRIDVRFILSTRTSDEIKHLLADITALQQDDHAGP